MNPLWLKQQPFSGYSQHWWTQHSTLHTLLLRSAWLRTLPKLLHKRKSEQEMEKGKGWWMGGRRWALKETGLSWPWGGSSTTPQVASLTPYPSSPPHNHLQVRPPKAASLTRPLLPSAPQSRLYRRAWDPRLPHAPRYSHTNIGFIHSRILLSIFQQGVQGKGSAKLGWDTIQRV